jgi:hypothetical protein
MAIKRDPSGRLQIDSPFMGESMMDKSLLASTDTGPTHRLMPDLIVVKIGGQSIIIDCAQNYFRPSWESGADRVRSLSCANCPVSQ